jgi:YbbR domain-containing protein
MTTVLPTPSRASILRLVASIGLALILWAWVTTLRDPESTRTFVDLPIVAEGLDENLVIVDDAAQAQVRLSGPESVIDGLQAFQIMVSVDLTTVGEPGFYSVPLEVEAPDGVWRAQPQPARVNLTIEAAVEREFEVESQVIDLDDSSLRSVSVQPTQDTVRIRGPESVVEQIAAVVMVVEVSGRSREYQTVLAPEAIDVNGEPVSDIEIEPSRIPASVTVSSRGKSVAVLVSTEGATAPGFEVIDRTSNPSTVVVEGPEAVIERLIALTTEPVDISGATTSISTSVGFRDLPEDVRILQPASGQVDVLVQIGQRGVRQALTGLDVMVTNLDSGLTATVEPIEVMIEVVAPEEVLSDLTVESFQVLVDANGLGTGSHQLEPMVIVPAQVQWISVTPATVEVEITFTESE